MTTYGIRLTRSELYAAENRKWLEQKDAKRFQFMTSAVMFATLELELAPDEYVVEPL